MSMNERVILIGRLEEKRQDATRARLKIEHLRDGIRDNLPRHEPVEHIRGDLVAQMAIELAAVLEAYRDHVAMIEAIKRDLGM